MANEPASVESTSGTSADPVERFGLSQEELAGLWADDPEDAESESASGTPASGSPLAPTTTGDTPAAGTPPALKADGTPADPAEVPPAPTPLAFKADGRDFRPEGAAVQPDGTVTFQPDAWKRFQHSHVADRQQIVQFRQQSLATQNDLRAQLQAAEQLRTTLLTKVSEVFQAPDEKVLENIYQFRQDLPVLAERLEKENLLAQLNRRDQQENALQQQTRLQSLEPQWKEAVGGYISQIADELGGGVESASLIDELWALKDAGLIIPAAEDDPEGQFQAGELVANLALIRTVVARAKREADRMTETKKQSEIVAKNQAALKSPTAPPAVPSGTPVPSGASSTSRERPKSAQEHDDRLRELVKELTGG